MLWSYCSLSDLYGCSHSALMVWDVLSFHVVLKHPCLDKCLSVCMPRRQIRWCHEVQIVKYNVKVSHCGYTLTETAECMNLFIENWEPSWCQLCRQWWHRRLSWRQTAVPPVTTKFTTWQPMLPLYLLTVILGDNTYVLIIIRHLNSFLVQSIQEWNCVPRRVSLPPVPLSEPMIAYC